MAGRFAKRHELDVDDVERLMNCIVEHATPEEGREAERLLAMLTMLRTAASEHGETTISFTPPRGTGALAERALAAVARSDKHAERAARYRPRRPASAAADARRRRGGAAPRTALEDANAAAGRTCDHGVRDAGPLTADAQVASRSAAKRSTTSSSQIVNGRSGSCR